MGLFAELENRDGVDLYNKTEVGNPHFNFYKYNPAIELQNSLVTELIQQGTPELYYMRREYVNIDLILGEDNRSKFKTAYKISAMIESFMGYQGQSSFMSAIGFRSEDEMTLAINPKLFLHQTDNKPPKMGDLVYFPMDNSLFEVTWIENDPFYPFGDVAKRTITLTKFVYSGEEINPTLSKNHTGDINTSLEDELDLSLIRNLDMVGDIKTDQYAEDNQFDSEFSEFIESEDVFNNKGTQYQNVKPTHPNPVRPPKKFNPFSD